MSTAHALWGSLVGQPDAARFLSGAVESGKVGHAYLFVGPAGSGKAQAARAFAAGVVCAQGGCGACPDCARVMRGAHPDVHELSPQSSQGYLIGQIRDLLADLDLAPVSARRRVYILDTAERLTSASANALLKSLEEPPEDVVFILLGASSDAILPTVLSRCQTVPFRPLSRDAAARALADEALVPLAIARRALACCPSPASARGFVLSEGRMAARTKAIECLANLSHADELDILALAKEAVLAAKAPLAEFKEAQQAVLDENAKILGSRALRELEERQKRELSARERSGIMESFAAQRSLLRDALGIAVHSSDDLVCDDFDLAAHDLARRLGCDGLVAALGQLDLARERVADNVSPQLAMESMLFTIKEMLTCRQ